MPAYKLSYFPIKGIAEAHFFPVIFVSRLLFVLAGEEFEDDQVPFDQWTVVKPSFGGQTAFEAAWVDALADQWKDYFVEIKPYLGVANGFLKTGDVDQLRKEVGEPVRDKHFALLEKAAQDNGANGFFVGRSLTWVDLLVADHISVFEQHVPGFFDDFPAVRRIQKTVQAEPRLKQYLEQRSETYF
ncbi:hypothetical protein PRIPAC_78005 [Pristionchus pacificus]|uniref:glutathione transferase n=1 Tax=Pristionchus pacificus TaxID=54126 RepID=A0A2A6CL70_PRIPA|nr:hypothetical protein PRIPAC_78005 [Pristionchus pacificus]|eukprot:PDM78850.1 Glutathione S-transferase [Pristionchus pacificus]